MKNLVLKIETAYALQSARKALGLSYDQIMEGTGINFTYVAKYFQNKKMMPVDDLIKITEFLNLGLSKEMFAYVSLKKQLKKVEDDILQKYYTEK